MFKRTLFAAVAAVTFCVPAWSQQTPSKPVEPVMKQDAQKPMTISVKNTTVLIDDVPIAGACWFPDGTLFLDDTLVDDETIGKNEILKGGGTAKKLAKLPKGMKLLPGTKLTLPPGGKLPEPPAPPADPKRIQIGKRAVLETTFDNDPKLQLAYLKYLGERMNGLESRVVKVENELVEIKKRLSPEEKAQRLQKKSTGLYHWSDCCNVTRATVNGVWYDLGPANRHSNGMYYYAVLAN